MYKPTRGAPASTVWPPAGLDLVVTFQVAACSVDGGCTEFDSGICHKDPGSAAEAFCNTVKSKSAAKKYQQNFALCRGVLSQVNSCSLNSTAHQIGLIF